MVRHAPKHVLSSLLAWAGPPGFAATVFVFLLMYLSAAGVEQTAASCSIPAPDCAAVVSGAHRFADDWKHGMLSGWPLFVPGFFLLTGGSVLWSRRRTWRTLVCSGPALMCIAVAAAWVLAPTGTARLLPVFLHGARLAPPPGPLPPPISALASGLLTVIAWTTLTIAFQRAVKAGRPWLLLLPLGLYAVLNGVRPGELQSLAGPWKARLLDGDAKALATTLLIPLLFALTWRDARSVSTVPDERGDPSA